MPYDTLGGTVCSSVATGFAALDSSGCRAHKDSRTGATGVASTLGLALGCSTVWTGGVRFSARFALHQTISLVTKKTKKRQQSNSKARILMVWSTDTIS